MQYVIYESQRFSLVSVNLEYLLCDLNENCLILIVKLDFIN